MTPTRSGCRSPKPGCCVSLFELPLLTVVRALNTAARMVAEPALRTYL
jgi:hypothetical protein